jgi:toxin-antitoxin system PIN domain toxin
VFVVDTNILVYAANPRAPHSDECLALLESWTRQSAAWCLTWGICYEFMRVVTHANVFRSPWSAAQALQFLEELQLSPGFYILTATERHAAVLARTVAEMPELSGNRMHDLHTAVLMREHGIRVIYTRDKGFQRFPFLEPVDPLGKGP